MSDGTSRHYIYDHTSLKISFDFRSIFLVDVNTCIHYVILHTDYYYD